MVESFPSWEETPAEGLFQLRRTLRQLVTYAENGGILGLHKDVPDKIREELYIKEQQRLEKDKRRGSNVLEGRTQYSPININVLQFHPAGLDINGPEGGS